MTPSPTLAVAGVPSVFSYEGVALKTGDFIRYVTGASCEADYVTFDGVSDKRIDANYRVELTFDHASLEPYHLCYKFEEEPYKLYDFNVDVATVEALVADCVERLGQVDILVNNAGHSLPGDPARTRPQ